VEEVSNIVRQIIGALTRIEGALARVLGKEDFIMKELDDLTAQTAANRSVIGSAIVLINGIAARIDAAGVDPTKLAALSASLKADDDDLAAAVVKNTPVAGAPAGVPPPVTP
jgi:hypothetical protein